MAKVLHLPARHEIEPPRIVAGRTAQVIDLSARTIFSLHAADDVAADFARLRNSRDREAAIAKLIQDYRRVARKRHGITGAPLDGACIAIEARLRRLIRQHMEAQI